MELSQPIKQGRQIIRERITTNRSMIKRTFNERGIAYASQLALQNCLDLEEILKWNESKGIKFFRMSSEIFPWASEYQFEDLPDWKEIKKSLVRTGFYAALKGHRLTFHPGPFNKLTSPKEHVIQNTIRDLEIHGRIMDEMNQSRTPYNKINIHVGAHYNNKPMALDNFCKNFERLSESVRSRLTVENDHFEKLFSVKELYDEVYSRIGIPIVMDYHHYTFCKGGQTEEEALLTAVSTWGGTIPVVHYSESKSLHENNPKIMPQAHSDYVNNLPNFYGQTVDCMVEAKAKEQAIMPFVREFRKVA